MNFFFERDTNFFLRERYDFTFLIVCVVGLQTAIPLPKVLEKRFLCRTTSVLNLLLRIPDMIQQCNNFVPCSKSQFSKEL